MAQKPLTKATRRWLHYISGEVHPNCVARATRELKRGHRRLVRRAARQQLHSSETES